VKGFCEWFSTYKNFRRKQRFVQLNRLLGELFANEVTSVKYGCIDCGDQCAVNPASEARKPQRRRAMRLPGMQYSDTS